MANQRAAVLHAIGAVALWSTVATAFKIALNHVSPLQLLCYSSLTSFLTFLAILLARRRGRELFGRPLREYGKAALLGLLNPFLYYLVLFQAYSRLMGQEALVLNYTWPIVLVLLSVFVLKQRLGVAAVTALAMSFFGVVLIATRGAVASLDFSDPLGVGLALGSSLVWASFWLLNVRDRRDAVVRLCLGFFFGSLYSVIVLSVLEGWSLPNLSGCLAVIYVGLFEMGIAFILWMRALKLAVSAALISNLVFFSPFVSLLLLHFIVGETIYLTTFFGLAFIIAGILLQRFWKRSGP